MLNVAAMLQTILDFKECMTGLNTINCFNQDERLKWCLIHMEVLLKEV